MVGRCDCSGNVLSSILTVQEIYEQNEHISSFCAMLAPVGEKVLMRGALNNASCEARRSHRYESVTKYLALDRANLFRFGALAAPALAASWQAIEGATPNVQVHSVPQNISTTYALAPRICRNYTFQHLIFFVFVKFALVLSLSAGF